MMMSRSLFLPVFAALLASLCSGGCGSSPAASPDLHTDGATPDHQSSGLEASSPDHQLPDLFAGEKPPRPDLYVEKAPGPTDLTMFVNLGDSIAAGYGVATTLKYRVLLTKNDDATYPDWKGKDFDTKYPGIQISDRSYPGATSDDLESQVAAVPINYGGSTLVVISIGGNDLMDNYQALLDPAQTKALADTVEKNVAKVVDHFKDTTKYPHPTYFIIFTIYDPTDGMADIPENAEVVDTCKSFKAFAPLVGKQVLASFAVYNGALITMAGKQQLMIGDNHSRFLGHAFNYNNKASLFYDAANPTLWLQKDCIHPNVLGHHEIRREVWRVLFGE